MIRLQCECGRRINAPDQYLGKRVKCPKCGKGILVGAKGGRAPASEPTPAGKASPVVEPSPFAESTPVTDSPSARSMPAAEPMHEDVLASKSVASPPDFSASDLDDAESPASDEHFSEDLIAAEGPAAPTKTPATPASETAAEGEGDEPDDPYQRRGVSLLGLFAIVL